MPTYICWARAGVIAPARREQVVEAITTAHAEEGRAPRYFVQVLFNDVAPGTHFIGGAEAPADLVFVQALIRSGRTDAQKRAIMERIMRDVSRISSVSQEHIWVYLSDIPGASVAEFGHVLPEPGGEQAWFDALPPALRARLSELV